jgi:hypothetical protein
VAERVAALAIATVVELVPEASQSLRRYFAEVGQVAVI